MFQEMLNKPNHTDDRLLYYIIVKFIYVFSEMGHIRTHTVTRDGDHTQPEAFLKLPHKREGKNNE